MNWNVIVCSVDCQPEGKSRTAIPSLLEEGGLRRTDSPPKDLAIGFSRDSYLPTGESLLPEITFGSPSHQCLQQAVAGCISFLSRGSTCFCFAALSGRPARHDAPHRSHPNNHHQEPPPSSLIFSWWFRPKLPSIYRGALVL